MALWSAMKSTKTASIGIVSRSISRRFQAYAGATELLELQTDSGAILRARIGASAALTGTHEFVFSASDATPVKD